MRCVNNYKKPLLKIWDSRFFFSPLPIEKIKVYENAFLMCEDI